MELCELCKLGKIADCNVGEIVMNERYFGCPNLTMRLKARDEQRLDGLLEFPKRYEGAEVEHAQIRAWLDEGPRRNLILSGPYGTGKSHTAAGIVLEARRRGISAVFANVTHLLRVIKSTFHDGSEYSDQNIVDMATAPRILVLDDLGKEKATEFVEEVLLQIVDARYNAVLPTVMTTNLKGSQMQGTDRLSAMASRLSDDALAIRLEKQWRKSVEAVA